MLTMPFRLLAVCAMGAGLTGCATPPPPVEPVIVRVDSAAVAPPGRSDSVRPGIEVFLSEIPPAVRGKRVGLITNHTGIDRTRRSTIDLLAQSPAVELVALYSPEHGIRGTAAAGEKIASGRDDRTGLPIHSLYGETRKPTAAMLEGVEVLIFDMQDVGARPYTYVSTMALGMEAARERGIPFVVLDRPNPIGGHIIEGNLLDTAYASFVGMYPIPARHGMTVGELARMYNERFGIGAELVVVPARGWSRRQWFDETGLPWLPPSPNLRRLDAAIHYPGTVFFEGTNLSEGRGSDQPFEQIGAPWLRAGEVAAAMNAMNLPGIRFEAVTFTPVAGTGKYPGVELQGIRFLLTDRERYRPVEASLRLIDLIHRLHPEQFQWRASIDRLAGTDRVREAIASGRLAALLRDWNADAERFRTLRAPYLIY